MDSTWSGMVRNALCDRCSFPKLLEKILGYEHSYFGSHGTTIRKIANEHIIINIYN